MHLVYLYTSTIDSEDPSDKGGTQYETYGPEPRPKSDVGLVWIQSGCTGLPIYPSMKCEKLYIAST